ncbi:Glycosyl transferase family 2 [Paenibacillaceae bacterium GAS479]|nr:Glycosyl transferase family 2 [Paenibacillaceae bacterium GAS479]
MNFEWFVSLGLLACGSLLLSERRLKAARLDAKQQVDESFGEARSSAEKEVAKPDWSVIIPARDEADNLAVLLPLLAKQTVPPIEIIVVDDGSKDGTAETAAAYPGVTVITAGELPHGWRGKNWACSRGAETARGSRLLFLDADTRPAEGFLAAAWNACGPGICLTIQPWHVTGSLREQLSAFLNSAVLAGSGRFIAGRWPDEQKLNKNRPRRLEQVQGESSAPASIKEREGRRSRWGLQMLGRVRAQRLPGAFGPCLACDRMDYEAVGGHASVRGEVLDHDRLARRFFEQGMMSRAMLGGRLLKFRMYSSGWGEMTSGWAKSIALGAGGSPLPALLLMILWISGLAGAAVGIGTELVQLLRELSQGGPANGAALAPSALPSMHTAHDAIALSDMPAASTPLGMQTALDAIALPNMLTAFSASMLLYILAALAAWKVWRHAGSFGWIAALFYPLPLIYFIVVFIYSLYRSYIRRRVSWKGRDLDVA